MEQATLPFDSCARKHRGNPRSVAANLRIRPHKASDRERVRIFIHGCGFRGATVKEIARAFGLGDSINRVSGRCSELKITREAFESGRSRENCDVLVSRWEWVTPEKKAELALRWLKESYRNGSAQ